MTDNGAVPFGHDFYIFWAMGRAVISGASPYDQAQLRREFSEIGFDPGGDPVLGNPPWVTWLLAPFGALDFEAARALWYCFMAAALVYAWRNSAPPVPRNGRLANDVSGILGALAFAPMLSNIIWGQSNWVAGVGLTARRAETFAAGMVFSLTMSKPHLFLPLFAYLVVSRLRSRGWDFLGGWTLGFALQVAVSLLLSPESFAGFPEEAARGGSLSLHFPAPTLAQIFESAAIRVGLVALGVTVGCAYGLGILRRGGVLFLIAVGVLTSPYSWSHSFVVLAPVFRSFSLRVGTLLLAVLGAVQYFLVVNPPLDRWYVLFPMVLAGWSLYADPTDGEPGIDGGRR